MAVMEAIKTIRCPSVQAYIEITSIPQTYEHLTLSWSLQGETNTNRTGLYLIVNSTTSSTYNYQRMQIYGTNMQGQAWTGTTSGMDGTMGTAAGIASNNPPKSVYGCGTVNIYDYTNSNKATTAMFQAWSPESGNVPLSNGEYFFESGCFTGDSLNAVDELKIYNSSYTIARESAVTLYGWNSS